MCEVLTADPMAVWGPQTGFLGPAPPEVERAGSFSTQEEGAMAGQVHRLEGK